MKLVEVVAVEDRSRAEGGHAVIFLRGVEGARESVTFDLVPVVADDDEDPERPAVGLTGLHALDVTMTTEGMALAIGPDIAESALFVPGAAVEITLPDVGVRGEFPWPAVTPHARPKRRNIMLKRNSADPLLRRSTASAPASEDQLQPPANSSSILPPVPPENPPASAPVERNAADEAPPPQSGGRRPIVLSSTVPRRAVQDGATGPVAEPAQMAGPAATPAGRPLTGLEPVPVETRGTALRASPGDEAPETAVPVSSPEPVTQALPPQIDGAATRNVDREAKSDESRSNPAAATTVVAAPEETLPTLVPPPARDTSAARAPRLMSTGSAVALSAAVLVAGQMIALRALNLTVVPRQAASISPSGPAAAVPSPVPGNSPAPAIVPGGPEPERVLHAGTQASPQRSVYDAIAAGPRSPRGVAAAGVSPAKSLELAHLLLHGPETERDAEEAAYWLRHYLAGATGGDHVRIALTQLGSAYAQPVRGERHYASARVVWELSAALGDPVAMCFLGAMHEFGLGTPLESRIAATWYDRATALGRICATAGQGGGSEGR